MHSADLERLRADQLALRQAVGVDLPFSRFDVLANICLAGWGALLAVWTSYVSPASNKWLVTAPLWLLLPLLGSMVAHAYRQRAIRPVAWREHRVSLIAGGVFYLAALVDRAWSVVTGAPQMLTGGTGVFVIGLAVTVVGLAQKGRLYYLGIGLPIMALGLALPSCDTLRQQLSVVGLCVFYGALATAALLALRLRREARLSSKAPGIADESAAD